MAENTTGNGESARKPRKSKKLDGIHFSLLSQLTQITEDLTQHTNNIERALFHLKRSGKTEENSDYLFEALLTLYASSWATRQHVIKLKNFLITDRNRIT